MMYSLQTNTLRQTGGFEANTLGMVAKSIWHHLRNHEKPLSAAIYRGIESFQGFSGGATWICPSTVSGPDLDILRQSLKGKLSLPLVRVRGLIGDLRVDII